MDRRGPGCRRAVDVRGGQRTVRGQLVHSANQWTGETRDPGEQLTFRGQLVHPVNQWTGETPNLSEERPFGGRMVHGADQSTGEAPNLSEVRPFGGRMVHRADQSSVNAPDTGEWRRFRVGWSMGWTVKGLRPSRGAVEAVPRSEAEPWRRRGSSPSAMSRALESPSAVPTEPSRPSPTPFRPAQRRPDRPNARTARARASPARNRRPLRGCAARGRDRGRAAGRASGPPIRRCGSPSSRSRSCGCSLRP